MAFPIAGVKKLEVSLAATVASADIGKNTHGLPFQPVVLVLVPKSNDGWYVDEGAGWNKNADGGFAVRITRATTTAAGKCVVYLGPDSA